MKVAISQFASFDWHIVRAGALPKNGEGRKGRGGLLGVFNHYAFKAA